MKKVLDSFLIPVLKFVDYEVDSDQSIPFVSSTVPAGFPSPAMNDMDEKISLFKELIKSPSTTFYMKVEGLSMIGAGISDGDIAVIDKSLEPQDGKIAVVYINGEFTLKRLKVDKKNETVWLMPENDEFKPIEVKSDNDSFFVWGMLINIIKSF